MPIPQKWNLKCMRFLQQFRLRVENEIKEQTTGAIIPENGKKSDQITRMGNGYIVFQLLLSK